MFKCTKWQVGMSVLLYCVMFRKIDDVKDPSATAKDVEFEEKNDIVPCETFIKYILFAER